MSIKVRNGLLRSPGGVQSLEAMLYTIDYINNHGIIPGVKIGAYILDDCDKDTYGLEQAVDFIKGSISNIDDVDITGACADGEVHGGIKHRVIAGVVGAASSVTSIQVANLLRLFKIPQVSYFSTSPELSNKQRFEYFSRTIPSDKHQVKAMVEIVKQFGWRYVSIVYEESNYGIKAFEELERLLPENEICIAAKEKLVKDSGVAGEDSYERIVDKLVAGKAKGVIIYGSDQEVKELMRAVRKRNETGSFAWIGSDGWSARTLVSDGNEKEVEGTLSVQPKANAVKGFDEYFLNLNVRSNIRNPWFIEFWENHWQCKYPNSSKTPYNRDFNKSCTGYEKLTAENTNIEAQLQYVSDAVMAFAYALKDMHKSLCGGNSGLCEKMNPVDGTELLEYLRKAKFQGLSEDYFHFDEFGDGPARYNIIHFRRREDSGTFHWTKVGDYNEGVLALNMSGVRFSHGSATPPTSICSKPCGLGEATRYVGGDKCCWSCLKCVNDQIRNPLDEQECFACPMGTFPNAENTVCVPIKEEYLRYSDGWAIGAMTFAAVGCILTAAVFGVFVAHNDTPVVRASGRELSYVILTALFFCYALTFLFIVRPNDWICGVQQFMTGFVFTVVYAALLTKTNRIARIFQAGKKSARRPSFISPRSQLVICSMMVSIQVLINVVWMLLQPPRAKYYYPSRHDNFLVCEAYINHSYAVAFWYPLLIICVCTVYAVLTRKIPEAFNESKYIGFTMYTTCIIWLAFVPIYFSTGTQVALRVTSMTVAISLSAYVMIACLFGPKLYIILFHPERNVRQSMMAPATRYSTIASTAAAAGGGPASLNASALGGSGAITPIQMTALKHNHFENSTKSNLAMAHGAQQQPPPVKVDSSTQCEDGGKGQQKNAKSMDTRRPSVLQTTISTQTEDLCSSRSNSGRAGPDLGVDENQDLNLPSTERKTHKLCNHGHDQENFSTSEVATTTDSTLRSPTSSVDVALMHPHRHHHEPQPQRPQRISFRKEGQPPTPNQQNRSNRNTVLGDSKSVTIIVAKDSGDVLL
ncbi:Metabotropic glutamate receptor 8 [Orchesella cincta]|uniref:Metabotropic glutamate receptor 8 n=1 Tax=Orchesella cincta TaxID=48709 RepID=A0A1D2N754_ORCCI|nr:Metabotropic glutamate receptor 8 [Orchesella cincta]